MKVYLAGFIQGSKLKECIEWRKRVRNYYKLNPDIEFLDPFSGKDLDSISQDGLNSSTPRNAIVHRDYAAVTGSELIVANMNTFGESRPPIGTICELAWAWENKIPIILISSDKNYVEHPFISYFASQTAKDVEDLLKHDMIGFFFQGLTHALY